MIEKLADTLRQKAAMEGKIVSLTSQGKMQGYADDRSANLVGIGAEYY